MRGMALIQALLIVAALLGIVAAGLLWLMNRVTFHDN